VGESTSRMKIFKVPQSVSTALPHWEMVLSIFIILICPISCENCSRLLLCSLCVFENVFMTVSPTTEIIKSESKSMNKETLLSVYKKAVSFKDSVENFPFAASEHDRSKYNRHLNLEYFKERGKSNIGGLTNKQLVVIEDQDEYKVHNSDSDSSIASTKHQSDPKNKDIEEQQSEHFDAPMGKSDDYSPVTHSMDDKFETMQNTSIAISIKSSSSFTNLIKSYQSMPVLSKKVTRVCVVLHVHFA